MNLNLVKQIFRNMATFVCDDMSSFTPAESIRLVPRTLGGKILTEKAYIEYVNTVDKISAIATQEGMWSRSSVDNLLWEQLEDIVQSEDVQKAVHEASSEIDRRFALPPSEWEVEIAVYGLGLECAGAHFGRLTFFLEEPIVNEKLHGLLGNYPEGMLVFARVGVSAIDDRSALDNARVVIDKHLMILNALCSSGSPSIIHVSRIDHMTRQYSFYRARKSTDVSGACSAAWENNVPLFRADFERVMATSVGSAINKMLLGPENGFTKRILSGYLLAGSAFVDAFPERRFLMFAIG